MNVIQNKIVGSMMWSAYGDALGFMSELVDTAGLVSRTGLTKVETTESWTYKLGGRYGAPIRLPAGMYSDDTQLRLATSRALGRDGQFNIDAFSKIELPVWLSYSLGGGKGTKAAAANLPANRAENPPRPASRKASKLWRKRLSKSNIYSAFFALVPQTPDTAKHFFPKPRRFFICAAAGL